MSLEKFPNDGPMPVISSATEAAQHIIILNDWLTERPCSMNESLRNVRRWYAIWNGDSQKWLLGFSKFIGYANMTGERYALYRSSPKGKREPLSGRITENKKSALWRESTLVEKHTSLHDDILVYLFDFLRSQRLKGPRKDYSIRLLNGFEKQ